MVSFKGAHFPKDIILMCVRWYVAYPLSTRHVEDLMQERGVAVDHSTVNRWVVKYSSPLAMDTLCEEHVASEPARKILLAGSVFRSAPCEGPCMFLTPWPRHRNNVGRFSNTAQRGDRK
jgi:hypothetical protein